MAVSAILLGGIGLAAGGIGAVLGVLSWRKTRDLETRLQTFMTGKDGQSLEALLKEHGVTLQDQATQIRDLVNASEYLHRAIQNSIRKVSFERYNPFPGVGGNQSFSLVLLDAFNSGVAITSLHNRESTRVYAKSIRNGKALQNLSEEENRVFQNALLMKGA